MRLNVAPFIVVLGLLGTGVPALETAPDDKAALVENALDALRDDVRELSHAQALRMALEAYYGFRAEQPSKVRNPYFYFVDYGLDNRTARGYVFDM
jgi:hypothetical protein